MLSQNVTECDISRWFSCTLSSTWISAIQHTIDNSKPDPEHKRSSVRLLFACFSSFPCCFMVIFAIIDRRYHTKDNLLTPRRFQCWIVRSLRMSSFCNGEPVTKCFCKWYAIIDFKVKIVELASAFLASDKRDISNGSLHSLIPGVKMKRMMFVFIFKCLQLR